MQNFKTKAVPRESVAINGAIKTVLHEIDRINVERECGRKALNKGGRVFALLPSRFGTSGEQAGHLVICL